AEHLPEVRILVGADRWQNARSYEDKYPVDVFILDDGFQHWRLKRELDIVLIDATDPWGNGEAIPRGILREPMSSLKRAGIFVISKCDLGKDNVAAVRARLNEIKPGAVIAEAVHRPVSVIDLRANKKLGLECVRGKRTLLLSSIGDPDSFEKTATGIGAAVEEKYSFMDHHVYKKEELAAVARSCRDRAVQTVLTTEKDAVKLKEHLSDFPPEIMIGALQIKMTIMEGQEEFFGRVASLLHR
ncbi:MAG TPA: tetraacyldisaccharide 4'-kinase, partial [Candidatus Manganitrophaceae bacterium]